MPEQRVDVAVVGGGPVGCVLAQLLARRGRRVEVFEKRPDLRRRDLPAGRSINLVLCDRGLRALDLLGLREQVLEVTVPVYGRVLHPPGGGDVAFQPYGRDESECNWSVPRGLLNERLLSCAEEAGVRLRFEHDLIAAEPLEGRLLFERGADREPVEVRAETIYGCDGAGSVVRRVMAAEGRCEVSLEPLAWGYKELTFPSKADGSFPLDPKGLHIWPRGEHFLMGLPNRDGTLTGTLYLRREGPESFAALEAPGAARAFFETHYADAVPLLPRLDQEMRENPVGHLGTVRCAPWNAGGRALLVGDAAHAIVPFFGQGLNAGFEDCAVLFALLGEHVGDTGRVFPAFSERRKPDADAIADMALENFVEMRERVGDAEFLLRKRVQSLLETRWPQRIRSRYAMVMYSSIPYHLVRRAGEAEREVLDPLCDGLERAEDVDMERASALIDAHLAPFLREHGIDLAL